MEGAPTEQHAHLAVGGNFVYRLILCIQLLPLFHSSTVEAEHKRLTWKLINSNVMNVFGTVNRSHAAHTVDTDRDYHASLVFEFF